MLRKRHLTFNARIRHPLDGTAGDLSFRRRDRLTRQQLIDSAWDTGTYITDRVVDTHVWSLRKKIEANPAAPRCLQGVRGIGYRFDLLTQP